MTIKNLTYISYFSIPVCDGIVDFSDPDNKGAQITLSEPYKVKSPPGITATKNQTVTILRSKGGGYLWQGCDQHYRIWTFHNWSNSDHSELDSWNAQSSES